VSAQPIASADQPSLAVRSYLETGFPYPEVSSVARADRFSRDAVYAAHKWWARRPPSVIRAILLAAALPANTSSEDFWKLYGSDETPLAGLHVGDPFMGGATTLVEAGRLGAVVTGIDVDPLAVLIGKEELSPLDSPETFAAAALKLIDHLRDTCGWLYDVDSDKSVPLHYFWLRRVDCTNCGHSSLMYRTPVLARDVGKKGAVVRVRGSEVFCPDCRSLHHVPEGREHFACCGIRHKLDEGTFKKAAHTCPRCGQRRKHEQLRTHHLQRVLIAVEETSDDGPRRFRPPAATDHHNLHKAQDEAHKLSTESIPTASLDNIDGGRPKLYGIETVADLFSARQQLVFAEAFSWLNRQDFAPTLKRHLQLGISNALAANNTLCGYATDYGRLAPLFTGVRSYSMPILGVELNPLHPRAGRGTLTATMRRVQHSLEAEYQRYTFRPGDATPERARFTARRPTTFHVSCQSAEQGFPDTLGKCDLVLTDPPYFDYIAYSDLSLVYRAWIWSASNGRLGGTPIHPVGDDAASTFGKGLGRAFARAHDSLKPEGALIFTFHSTNPDAWNGLAQALRRARLTVSAVFPVWTDARAVAHAHPGNCEWDLVFTCRGKSVGLVSALPATIDSWIESFGPNTGPTGYDLDSLRLGLEAARKVNEEEITSHEQGRAS